MKIGVLGQAEGYYVQDLQRAAVGRCDFEVFNFDTLSAELAVPERGIGVDESRACNRLERLSECDVVLVRTMPWGSLEQIVFRVDLLHDLEQRGVRVVNSPACLEIAIDKFRTLSMVAASGLPVPGTVVCQTVGDALDAFDRLGGDVVVKPLFGGEGRGMMRVEDCELAGRVFKTLTQMGAVLYLQSFIPHGGWDLRVLQLGNRRWSIRRSHESDWRTNVSRGGRAEVVELPSEWVDLAERAAGVVQAEFAGVDLIVSAEGTPLVLEVNAVPGWRGVVEATGVDVAAEMLDQLLESAGV